MTEDNISIDIVVSQEKLNDFNYVQCRLFETKLMILFQISQNSNKLMSELVKNYLKEIQAYEDADKLLEKYSLSIESLFKNNTEPVNDINTIEEGNDTPTNNEQVNTLPIENSQKSVKKIVLKLKQPIGSLKKRILKIKKLPSADSCVDHNYL